MLVRLSSHFKKFKYEIKELFTFHSGVGEHSIKTVNTERKLNVRDCFCSENYWTIG